MTRLVLLSEEQKTDLGWGQAAWRGAEEISFRGRFL